MLRRLVNEFKRRIGKTPRRKTPRFAVDDILQQRALERSADFIEPHLASAMLFRRAEEIRSLAIRRVIPEGMLLEFGVNLGDSINYFADALAKRGDRRPIFGFDAFGGLAEDWFGRAMPKQTNFNRGGKTPRVRENVRLVVGWLEETLRPFLDANPVPIAFMHLDMDTYSPARLALDLCRDRLVEGTLILLDEHHGFPNWENGEFKALNEVLRPDEFGYVAFAAQQALIRVARPLSAERPAG
ncbi:MAG: class I SAM-dependent methyltransferase [Propylenella sp.]